MIEGKKMIFVVGPTSAGKTDFSLKLARRLPGEIISADSMQAYRHMDIISQKPTEYQRKEIPHYLVDILEPREEYSAAEFIKRASTSIDIIIGRNKIPIIVGGSGLYIKALIDGLFPGPKKDPLFREGLETEARENGPAALYNRLKEIDPQTASNIHPNDLRRIIRAMEVFHLTGIPISIHKKQTVGIKDRFNIMLYGLLRRRENLYKRIEEKVEEMFKNNLVAEVKNLVKKAPSITARSSLGYKEVSGYLNKHYSLEEAKNLLKKNTRRFAKRQMTWFRADKRIKWIDLDNATEEDAVELIIKEM